MTDRELMQQALDVLKIFIDGGNSDWARKIEALRDRLAQPEEPDWSAAGFSKPPTHSEAWWKHEASNAYANGYEKGRASVKQPEQEPVAWIYSHKGQKSVSMNYVAGVRAIPLYTAPPQRDEAPAKAVEWQGLTDEDIRKLSDDCAGVRDENEFIRAIEAKLKEKNT